MPCLISVVTVNRNDASGLRATARSIVAQERAPDEWIVVDGGSTDASLQVIREFEAWIASWSSVRDRGAYDGMNRGLRRARGQYVIFMNSGDRFAGPDTLARIVAALASRPEVDLVFGGTILALPSGRCVHRPARRGRRIRYGLPAYHQATVIRRVPHLMAPYDLALPISAEYGAIATLISRGATTARLDQPVAVRACHPDSLSERSTLRRFADFVAVQRQVLGMPPWMVFAHLARLVAVHLAYRIARDNRILPRPTRGRAMHKIISRLESIPEK